MINLKSYEYNFVILCIIEELKTQVADKEIIIAKLTEEKLKLKEELQSLSDATKDKGTQQYNTTLFYGESLL